jgi:hypothetical protein
LEKTMTPVLHPPPIDAAKAEAIWKQYQSLHDVSAYHDQAVGIDPETGEVWFGESASQIADQMRASHGVAKPLYFTRVGTNYYVRKGGRR